VKLIEFVDINDYMFKNFGISVLYTFDRNNYTVYAEFGRFDKYNRFIEMSEEEIRKIETFVNSRVGESRQHNKYQFELEDSKIFGNFIKWAEEKEVFKNKDYFDATFLFGALEMPGN